MRFWLWFLAPPAIFMAAYYLTDAVSALAVPPPPPPAVAELQLAQALLDAAGRPLQPAQNGHGVRDIRLAAFGVGALPEAQRVPSAPVVPSAPSVPGLQASERPFAADLLRLESVLVVGERRVVVINGILYEVGDRIQQRYRLLQVEPDRVWLEGPRGREALVLPDWAAATHSAQAPAAVLQLPAAPRNLPESRQPNPSSAPAAAIESQYRKILDMLKL